MLKLGRWRLTIPSPIGPDGGMGPAFSTGDRDDDEVLRQVARVSPLTSGGKMVCSWPAAAERVGSLRRWVLITS